MQEEVVMRIVGCGLIAVAALLGLAPPAMASEGGPQAEVSMLAVALTAGAAVAAAGSGVAHAVNRRRAVSRAPGQTNGDTVRL